MIILDYIFMIYTQKSAFFPGRMWIFLLSSIFWVNFWKVISYNAYINRANYYFRKGEYDPAITDAKQALEFKNNGVEAASLLTVIYSLRGDENNKKHYYHLAITSGKRPSELDQAIEYFLNENRSGEE